jgi:hypothetical protein
MGRLGVQGSRGGEGGMERSGGGERLHGRVGSRVVLVVRGWVWARGRCGVEGGRGGSWLEGERGELTGIGGGDGEIGEGER